MFWASTRGRHAELTKAQNIFLQSKSSQVTNSSIIWFNNSNHFSTLPRSLFRTVINRGNPFQHFITFQRTASCTPQTTTTTTNPQQEKLISTPKTFTFINSNQKDVRHRSCPRPWHAAALPGHCQRPRRQHHERRRQQQHRHRSLDWP